MRFVSLGRLAAKAGGGEGCDLGVEEERALPQVAGDVGDEGGGRQELLQLQGDVVGLERVDRDGPELA